jgi:hypothetical protein
MKNQITKKIKSQVSITSNKQKHYRFKIEITKENENYKKTKKIIF